MTDSNESSRRLQQKVNRCVICGEFDDSRLAMSEHVFEEHTLQERQNALIERTQRPEVEADD